MNELQIGLVLAGVAAVGAVVAYNKWVERKQGGAARKAFGGDAPDVLNADAGQHPGKGARSGAHAEDRVEPGGASSYADVAAGLEGPAVVVPPAPPDELADPRLDCVLRLDCPTMVLGGVMMQAQRESVGETAKPLRWLGFDEKALRWDAITYQSSREYRSWCAAMQLVDRRGPVAEGDLKAFIDGMQRLADQFLAVVEDPPVAPLLDQAVQLDRACADLDIQVGVNVVAAEGQWFAGPAIRRALENLGAVMDTDGAFHFRDMAGADRFVVSNGGEGLFDSAVMTELKTPRLTLVLDVPRVPDAGVAFDDMARSARRMAGNLGGSVVDDAGNLLSDDAIRVIRNQIAQHLEHMNGAGIPAGGPAALRLFS